MIRLTRSLQVVRASLKRGSMSDGRSVPALSLSLHRHAPPFGRNDIGGIGSAMKSSV
jgi:hypothetical protein